MEPTLKKIKTELKEIKNNNNLKYSHENNHIQETVEYSLYYGLNRKKHYLTFRFVYQKKENTLSFIYEYAYHKKQREIKEVYSLLNYQNTEFPGMDDIDEKQISSIYKFVNRENKIVNEIALKTQAEIVVDIFKKHYKSMIKYVKNLDA